VVLRGFPLKRLSQKKQRRMDELADKCHEGLLTKREYEEYARLVDEAQRLTVENAKRLAQWASVEQADERSGAKPSPRRRTT